MWKVAKFATKNCNKTRSRDTVPPMTSDVGGSEHVGDYVGDANVAER